MTRNPKATTLPNTAPPAYQESSQRALRQLLMTLVLVLTFEGLARKLQIPGTNIPIFLLKDVVVFIMGFHVLRIVRPPELDFLWGAYLMVGALFLPVIVSTALHDPILAVYGAKQYLLYPTVGIAFFLAFKDQSIDQVIRFFRWTSLLIIPTTVVALIQLRLPTTHWLNLSVQGESLEGFSAGDELRVSSTFSFVAQYAGFLNGQLFMLAIAFTRINKLNFFWKLIYFSLIPLLVIGNYETGSRGAVVGATVTMSIVLVLMLLRFDTRNSFRLIVLSAGLFVLVFAGQHYLPREFAAYSDREQGHLVGFSSEIQGRAYLALFNWMGNIFTTPLFGNGLAIMSNGTELFSDYAGHIRDYGDWTETDFATTLFEGGIYLVMVWYGFRFYVIYQTWRRSMDAMLEELALPAYFCQACVILWGINSTLGMQAPLAIWWWLAVGTSLILWWKCVEPVRDGDGLVPAPPPPPEKKVRGRSAYADRLHRN